jgi:VWFA-related protein
MAWRTWCAVLPLALVGGTAVLAQSLDPREIRLTAAPYLPKAATTIKVETRLVDVGVVVRDGRGHPVSGLGKQDFELWDNGKRHEVTAFSVQTFLPATPSAAAASATALAGALEPRTPAAPPKPRFMALVFDDISMPPGDLGHARLAAKRFLKTGMAVNDLVAILKISSGVVLPFTANQEALADAIDKITFYEKKNDSPGCPTLKEYDAYLIANHMDMDALNVKAQELVTCDPGICGRSGGGSRRGGGGSSGACPAAVQQVQQMSNVVWEQVRFQSQNTLRTLQSIVDFMARMNGTRVILLASSGFLSGTMEFDQDLIVERALHANVVINSLDAKGLYTEDAPEMGPGAGVRSVIYAQTQGTRPKEATNDAMGNLADSTGGLFFHNSNDLDRGFRDLGMQPETSYLLGFIPDPPDGKYHHLKVGLTAKSHDSLQSRKGYMSVAAPQAKPAPERRLDREVLSGSQLSEVPVTVAVQPVHGDDGTLAAHLALRWDVPKMPFQIRDGARSLKVGIVAAFLDEHGNFVTGREGLIEFALSENSYARALSGGLTIGMNLEAPAGNYRLRTVVVEEGDDRVTASTQSVELK